MAKQKKEPKIPAEQARYQAILSKQLFGEQPSPEEQFKSFQTGYDEYIKNKEALNAFQADYDAWVKAKTPAEQPKVEQAIETTPTVQKPAKTAVKAQEKTRKTVAKTAPKEEPKEKYLTHADVIPSLINKSVKATKEANEKEKEKQVNSIGGSVKQLDLSKYNLPESKENLFISKADATMDKYKKKMEIQEKTKLNKAIAQIQTDYRMTKEEEKQAKKTAKSELNKLKGKENLTEEEQRKKNVYSQLKDKTSAVNAFGRGFTKLPFGASKFFADAGVDVYDAIAYPIASVLDDIQGTGFEHRAKVANTVYDETERINQNYEALRAQQKNAKTQHPTAYNAGDTTGQLAAYYVTNPLIEKGLKGIGIASKGAQFLIDQAAQNAQDIAFDEYPEYVEMMEDGVLTDEERTELKKRRAANTFLNLVPPSLQFGEEAMYDSLTKTLGNDAEIFNKIDFTGGLRNAPDIAREGKDILNSGNFLNEKKVPDITDTIADTKQYSGYTPNANNAMYDTSSAQDAVRKYVRKNLDPVEKTLLDENVINTHTPEELAKMQDYVKSTNKNIVDYVNNVISTPKAKTSPLVLGEDSERAVNDIKRLTGIDTTGNTTVIAADDVTHIYNRHGKNGKADHSMADINTLGRMEYIKDNYDEMFLGKSSRKRLANGKRAPTVVYVKKIDGQYYAVEAVTDARAKRNYITSAYIGDADSIEKNIEKGSIRRGEDTLKNAPSYTSKNEVDTTSLSDYKVSDKTSNVNKNTINLGQTLEAQNIPEIQDALNNSKLYNEYPTGNLYDPLNAQDAVRNYLGKNADEAFKIPENNIPSIQDSINDLGKYNGYTPGIEATNAQNAVKDYLGRSADEIADEARAINNANEAVRAAEEVNAPKNPNDYVSEFRTHNEQNFNLTDEELNSKYFNTQNENFHFLKGDRAGDIEKATKNLETNYEGTVRNILDKPLDKQFTPQEVDEGFMAWNRELEAARVTGDYSNAADILYRMTIDAHDKGAGLNAYVAWKKNTPAGVVLDATESARKMAIDQFGKKYIDNVDKITKEVDKILKSGDSLEDQIKKIDKLFKEAKGKGYRKGLRGFTELEEALANGNKPNLATIRDMLYEANKIPTLSGASQNEIAQLASEMYGKELTKAEKRKYINKINMILSREKNWSVIQKAVEMAHVIMLSSPRTHVRNIVANIGMLPQEALARKISAIGQNAYRHLVDPDYKPTQAFHVTEESKKLAADFYDAKGGADAIVEGASDKYGGKAFAGRIGPTYMFGNKKLGSGKKNIIARLNEKATSKIPALKKLEKKAAERGEKLLKKMGSEGAYDAMDAELSTLENARQGIYGSLSGLEDNPYVKENFVNRLASYIEAQKIKNIDDIPEDAFDIARAEALKATFKDDNAITKLFTGIKGIPIIGELELPFLKAPANLLARSIDFSPIGLARELYGAVNKNSRFARNTMGETIDEISKGLGGSLTMLLGMYLYEKGILTGKKSDDAEIANYMANEGWQEYSISSKGVADFINDKLGTDIDLGDNYYDYSFMQPSTTNIIAGQELWDELMDGKKITEKDADEIFNRAKSIAGSYTDALLAQSTLQNVQEAFGSQYSEDGLGGNLIQNALEFPTRYTSGIINDIAKLSDNTKREYYSKNKPVETVINALQSKIPGLEQKLPAKYDVFGNEQKRNKSTGGKIFNTLLNPSTSSYRNSDPLYDFIDNINEQSENGDYVPKKPDRKIVLNDKSKLSLDNKQYSEYSRISGEERDKLLTEVQENELFNSLSADEQVPILDALDEIAVAKGRRAVAEEAKVTEDAEKTIALYEEKGIKGVIDNAVAKSYAKENNLQSGTKAFDAILEAVEKGDIEDAKKLAGDSGKAKEILSKYDVNASTNAAKEVNEAVQKGNIEEAEKIAEKEAEYNKACEELGITEKNAATKKAFKAGGKTGLSQYKRQQDNYGKYNLENDQEARSVQSNWGESGLKTLSELKKYGLGSTATNVYESAKKENVSIPSVKDFATTFNAMDKLNKKNGSVDQKEFKAYLNAGNYTQEEAARLAKIYGNWKHDPKKNKKGEWYFPTK